MTHGLEIAGWREAHIGFENDGLTIDGVDVWKQPWRPANVPPVQLPHPAHPQQIHRYDVHDTGDSTHPVRFAACELSNGVWGFYVPADDPVGSSGVSVDGSLRHEQRPASSSRPNDPATSCAVLIDCSDGRVLVDCAAWASSRIAANPDGSLSLHLQLNSIDVLFGINPATRLFCNVVEPGPAQPLADLADAVEQARLATIREGESPMSRRISPDGTICVDLAAVEWSNSHWVNAPRVTDVASGRVVLDLWNTAWDATVSFPARSRVLLGLRRYRLAGDLAVDIDLSRNSYQIFIGPKLRDALPEAPLADIGAGLEAASRRAADIAASEPVGHGGSPRAPPPRPFAAWRIALLILACAITVIAVGTYWSLQHAPSQKLDVVPTMPK